MDVNNFVPKLVRDYYDSSENDSKKSSSHRGTREPYKTVICSDEDKNDYKGQRSDNRNKCNNNSRNYKAHFLNFDPKPKDFLSHTCTHPLQNILKSVENRRNIENSERNKLNQTSAASDQRSPFNSK